MSLTWSFYLNWNPSKLLPMEHNHYKFSIFSLDNDYQLNLYFPSYARMGPYIVGLFTGYMLYRTKCKIRIPKVPVFLHCFRFVFTSWQDWTCPTKCEVVKCHCSNVNTNINFVFNYPNAYFILAAFWTIYFFRIICLNGCFLNNIFSSYHMFKWS